jgi:hypothetical protein
MGIWINPQYIIDEIYPLVMIRSKEKEDLSVRCKIKIKKVG